MSKILTNSENYSLEEKESNVQREPQNASKRKMSVAPQIQPKKHRNSEKNANTGKIPKNKVLSTFKISLMDNNRIRIHHCSAPNKKRLVLAMFTLAIYHVFYSHTHPLLNQY